MYAQVGSWYVMWGRGVQLHLNTNCTYMYILQEQSPFFFGNGSRFLTLASQPVSTDSWRSQWRCVLSHASVLVGHIAVCAHMAV